MLNTDKYFKKINDHYLLNQRIKMLTGLVDTGLFIDLADMVIVGKGNETEIIKKFANDLSFNVS